ncbi:thioesterase II family protein [Streptomyces rubellomurinus]|uniref:Oleoyl-ACP hydrolase n=1 Tax=Streptomyces rubellomurinus (strain ATCC 31215) TaxID=359131 RepID=A0A0F2T802_STRR3|nr:alpha/beta fold hydrolase [Streptomyces rubellomurinus]KJS57867.1 oleoyl-ACP hydrolase [Streptomyces rubellomurinus]
MTDDRDLWIRQFTPGRTSGPLLVCFPHAGGSATFFRPLALELASLEAVGVQYPGRQDRLSEPCLGDVASLADEVFAVLQSLTGRPLVFLGHSMGAVIAFEVARRFRQKQDGVPLALIASGRRAPSIHRDEEVHKRDDEGLIAEIRRLSGTANSLLDDDEIVRMILPATRADYRAIETYRYEPGPQLDCPVTVLTGDADPRVTVDETRAWADQTSGPFDLQVFPGGHFYLSDDWAATARAVAAVVATLPGGAAQPV